MTASHLNLYVPPAILSTARSVAATRSVARLRASAAGCELLAADGRVVFEASGRGARTRCLRRAADLGVLCIVR